MCFDKGKRKKKTNLGHFERLCLLERHLLFCLQLSLFALLRAREGMELNLAFDVDVYPVRTIHIRVRGVGKRW